MSERNVTSARLRDALLEDLVYRIENGEMTLPKGAEDPIYFPASSATLNAAINFLKAFPPDDLSASGELSGKLRQYAEEMPFK